MTFKERIIWRSVLLLVTFLPVGASVIGLAYMFLYQLSLSIPMALLFVGLAYFVGYAMSNTRMNNLDGSLSRMGPLELKHMKVLIDEELRLREEAK